MTGQRLGSNMRPSTGALEKNRLDDATIEDRLKKRSKADDRGEILCMEWDEIDFANGWWVIPGVRTKNRLEHRVPLVREAVALLRSVREYQRDRKLSTKYLVMASADLEKASDGVMRSSFGATGQKCSACSRVYVSRDVRRIMDEPFNHGYFVEPTVIDGLPAGHPLFREELFVPITVVADVLTLDEAIDLANRTEYGLTAGIFSEDEREVQEFFERIEAGVTYANRRAGATTGAWPGQNSFGGWKASGSTGKGTGGPHYLQQFFREQNRTRVR